MVDLTSCYVRLIPSPLRLSTATTESITCFATTRNDVLYLCHHIVLNHELISAAQRLAHVCYASWNVERRAESAFGLGLERFAYAQQKRWFGLVGTACCDCIESVTGNF